MNLKRTLSLLGVLLVISYWSIALQAQETEESSETVEEADKASDEKSPLEALLSTDPGRRDYNETQNCVSKARIRSHEILNERLIVLKMSGTDQPKLLIQFDQRCMGLKPGTLINMESRGSSRLCSGDYIRTEVYDFGQRSWGPRCYIPGFEPVSEHQVTLLKEALGNGRVK